MTREQRITNGTIGVLLCISAILLPLIIPAVNVWPWVMLFASVGIGLTAGAAAAKDAENKKFAASATQPRE